MKTSRYLVIVGSVTLMGGAGVWAGCGGDDTVSPGVDAGPDTSTADTGGNKDTGAPDTGSDTGSDGGTGSDGAVPTTCAAYCTLVTATCTGSNAQYIDNATCLAMCAKFPVGDAGAQSGNSLACRAYHTTVAAQSAPNATTHCPHAGPWGFGGCGTEGENFCFLDQAQCTDDAGYGANCPTTFGAVPDGPDAAPFVITATGGNSRDCREYHLENAYKGNVTSGTHCIHASQSGAGACQ